MNIIKKAYCRTYQTVFRLVTPFMKYREPEILEGVENIAEVLERENITQVLIVSDKSITELGLTASLEKTLRQAKVKYEIFIDVVPNPTIDNVELGLSKYTEFNCQAIIAIGGGSVIDCAKTIGARASNPKTPVEKMKGLLKIKNPLPTLFAIPTTAGTGSETTLTAVITDDRNKSKYTINDFDLIPKYAVLDPKLTIGLPKNLTATTGMDALTHAIEAFIGNSTTEQSRKQALDAANIIFENILKVYEDGSNERARSHMLRGAYLAGLAFSRSYVGYVHAIAHSLGGEYGIPHGLANAVILPYVLSEYGSTIHTKIKKMATYCGIAKPYDSEEIATSKFINKIFELNELMGIPKTFEGIKEDDIEKLAKHADKEANPLYPVPKLLSAKELTKIYYKIMA